MKGGRSHSCFWFIVLTELINSLDLEMERARARSSCSGVFGVGTQGFPGCHENVSSGRVN